MDSILRLLPLFMWDMLLSGSISRFIRLYGGIGVSLFSCMFLVVMCLLLLTVLFFLETEKLKRSYFYLGAGAALTVSLGGNDFFINMALEKHLSFAVYAICLTLNALLQVSVGYIYNGIIQDVQKETDASKVVLWDYYSTFRPFIYTVLLTPALCSVLGLPSVHLQVTPAVVFGILMLEYLLVMLSCSSAFVNYFFHVYHESRQCITDFGVLHFIELHWTRLQIPRVLRIFWTLRFSIQAVLVAIEFYDKAQNRHNGMTETLPNDGNCSRILYDSLLQDLSQHSSNDVSVISPETEEVTSRYGVIFQVFITCLAKGCNNVITLLGMTSVLSGLAHYLGLALSWYINAPNDADRSIGTMTAMLFFILALQTGLTSMRFDQRLTRLTRNMYLVLTAILHVVHSMVNPVLQTLSTQYHHLPRKHVRALTMCVFLIVFPCCLLVYLWSHHSVGTWLLAVTAFSVEVVIKVLLSLLVYLLFMIDAYRSIMWENLDDTVYWIKATGNCVEFLFGIFLFFNGAWILLFESGGTIRAFMMGIHAYFNIWGQARDGWATFMRRRGAVSKIDLLPVATEEDLARLNDVCAICYSQLESNARITACGHYFHGACLKKWLYVQELCPMCHEKVNTTEETS